MNAFYSCLLLIFVLSVVDRSRTITLCAYDYGFWHVRIFKFQPTIYVSLVLGQNLPNCLIIHVNSQIHSVDPQLITARQQQMVLSLSLYQYQNDPAAKHHRRIVILSHIISLRTRSLSFLLLTYTTALSQCYTSATN